MQDLSSAAAAYYHHHHQSTTAAKQQPELLPEQEQLNCPRCDSPNTKFCYYNNYNLSQPRHFCKNCRRYWTKGGALRNIPVGGGSRKNSKRPGSGSGSGSSSSSSNNLKNSKPISVSDLKPDSRDFGSGSGSKSEEVTGISGQEMDPTRMLYGLPVGDPNGGGSFSSLLASNMRMGGLMYETGSSGWYPDTGLGLDSGIRRRDDTWTDLAMNRVEKN